MLVFYLLIVLFYNSGVISQTNPNNCESKRTCNACLQVIGCAWCINLKNGTGKENHCRPKDESSWCKDEPVSPETNMTILQNQDFSNSLFEPIQIKPQILKLKLRKGGKHNLTFQYKMTKNYPVDLYFLMDMSFSMKDYKEELAKLGTELVETMKNCTTDLKLGFGIFVDKVALPFSNPTSDVVSYSFQNLLPLTSNITKFTETVNNSKPSENIDSPEGGFDAMIQTFVCEDIKWRKQARRLLVFCTDEAFHVAGDGKLAGVLEPNPAKCYENDEDYLKYDYPSVYQLNYVAKQNKISIIFGIVSERGSFIHKSYERLTNVVENSNLGLLGGPNRSEVVKLVVDNYRKISQRIVFTTDAPNEVNVKIYSSCSMSTVAGRCDEVGAGDVLNYTATITAIECLRNRKEVINLYPTTINQNLNIELETDCECSCSMKDVPEYENTSVSCSNQGYLVCGVCDCKPGKLGANCERDESISPNKNDTDWIMGGEKCTGHGDCECGQCKRGENGLICSGNGKCNCNKCECFSGYEGDVCECKNKPEECLAPGSNMVCSGHGKCVCSKCECIQNEERYSGRYCQECLSCSAKRCDEFKDCVICRTHKSGKPKGETCNSNSICKHTINEVEKLYENDPSMMKCQVPDNENCLVFFEYYYDNEAVNIRVLKERICPIPVNVLAWIAGVVGCVLLAGMIALIIWKIATTVHDRREYARFLEDVKNQTWSENRNPHYKPARTSFKNPLFRLSRTFSISKKA